MTDARQGLIEVAVEAWFKADHGKLLRALAELAAQDSSLRVKTDPESGQIILGGMSELHLDQAIDVLRRTYELNVNVGAPQVAIQERVTRRAEVDYTHKKQSGGIGEFAAVSIVVEPNEPGRGNTFESKVAGGAVPDVYITSVEKGVRSVLAAGVVAGFPVVGAKVQLVDGKHHDVDSSALAFEIAARAAFREALQKAKSVLFEPIMQVEVVTPEGLAGAVIDDLKLRRGQIRGQESRGNTSIIDATVPLMNMFGYVNNLRPMSRGRATFTMKFSHYAPAPLPDDDPPFGSAVGMRA